MKTKFILHGGFTPKKEEEDNEDFYKEILRDTPEKVRILIVPFAKDIERIATSTKKVMAEFDKNKQQQKLDFEIANEKSFTKQLKLADVVYFQGGVTLKLLGILKKFHDLSTLLDGKIIAGESAGANVFGKFFFSPSANNTFEGLGIIPIKIVPHYSEKYKDVFKNIEPNLENLFLKEYEYKVLQ